MPRYFLHLRDGTDETLDPEGVELPNLGSLKAKALHCARDTMSHDVKTGRLDLKWRIEAEDADGRIVCSVPFAQAVEINLTLGGGFQI